jgi:hypothetical protein
MLYKKSLLFIVSFFVLLSCNEELTTTFIDINITTDNNNLVEINIPNAIGTDLISTNINSEISKVVITELHVGETDSSTAKSIEESITLFNEEYNAFNTDFPDSTAPWEVQIDGELLFQSYEIISIAITSYMNTGGAHGITNISFINFDAATGKRIPNDKLFKNEAAFKDAAQPYFEAALKEDDIIFDPDNFKLPANIGYNEEGIIFLYNTYEIAPYSTGIIDFTIPIDKVSPFLVFDSSK